MEQSRTIRTISGYSQNCKGERKGLMKESQKLVRDCLQSQMAEQLQAMQGHCGRRYRDAISNQTIRELERKLGGLHPEEKNWFTALDLRARIYGRYLGIHGRIKNRFWQERMTNDLDNENIRLRQGRLCTRTRDREGICSSLLKSTCHSG